jgi:hypothetical protein
MSGKNKKTLDIIPPQLSTSPKRNFGEESTEEIKQKKSPSSFLLIVCAVILLVGAAAYFFIPPKAEITIWPSIEEISFEVTREISGTLLREEEAFPQDFYLFGTEETETRAEGIIRVYNEFHLEQSLVVGTRFWCLGEEAVEFKTKEMVTISSGSHLDVEVIASLPGEELNIRPCKVFSVPGLAGSARYTAVYGESFAPMQGGESFTGVLVVKKSELENIAREYVLTQIPQERKIQKNSLAIDCSSYSADLGKKNIILDLKITVGIYTVIDQEAFKRAVRGVDFEQIKELMVDFPEIRKIDIEWWPFWVTRAPEDVTSIDIKLDV